MPPVIVIEQPDDFFRVFMHVMQLQLIWSSDVQVPTFRLLQPPDDEIPTPTDLISVRAAECVILQASAVKIEDQSTKVK